MGSREVMVMVVMKVEIVVMVMMWGGAPCMSSLTLAGSTVSECVSECVCVSECEREWE